MSEGQGLRVADVRIDRGDRTVLRDLTFHVPRGRTLAVVGPSGVGKTSLLDVLCGLSKPTEGTVSFDDFNICHASSKNAARWRLRNVGVVYQFAELLPELTLSENVQLPLLLAGLSGETTTTSALEALASLQIEHLADAFPSGVSGGERQRAAIARAIVHRPGLLIADEPTGALDPGTAQLAGTLLLGAAQSVGAVLVVATHNPDIASLADAVLDLRAATVGSTAT